MTSSGNYSKILMAGMQLFQILQILYGLAQGFVKVSSCQLLMSLFNHRPKRKMVLKMVFATSLAWMIAAVLVGAFVRRPLPGNQNHPPEIESSTHQSAAFVAIGVVDVVVDLSSLISTIIWLVDLPTSQRQKAAIITLFGFTFMSYVSISLLFSRKASRQSSGTSIH